MSKSQIMRQAWSLYRATVAEFPETRSRAQFAVCLKEAHRAAQAAAAARREWEAMDGEAQYAALIRMAWTVKGRAEDKAASADDLRCQHGKDRAGRGSGQERSVLGVAG